MCVCVCVLGKGGGGIERGYMAIMHYFCHNELETKMRNNGICPTVAIMGVAFETQQLCLYSLFFM